MSSYGDFSYVVRKHSDWHEDKPLVIAEELAHKLFFEMKHFSNDFMAFHEEIINIEIEDYTPWCIFRDLFNRDQVEPARLKKMLSKECFEALSWLKEIIIESNEGPKYTNNNKSIRCSLWDTCRSICRISSLEINTESLGYCLENIEYAKKFTLQLKKDPFWERHFSNKSILKDKYLRKTMPMNKALDLLSRDANIKNIHIEEKVMEVLKQTEISFDTLEREIITTEEYLCENFNLLDPLDLPFCALIMNQHLLETQNLNPGGDSATHRDEMPEMRRNHERRSTSL